MVAAANLMVSQEALQVLPCTATSLHQVMLARGVLATDLHTGCTSHSARFGLSVNVIDSAHKCCQKASPSCFWAHCLTAPDRPLISCYKA